ncbi:lactate utilization protein [Kineothrix sp. MB12-C1]|uniref:lactate utilization protein n=1 Tax=Kineothrix sp. MB12-C1 TaxID=3070215 RepID=UPI0027D2A617|nr:lactate utilization protein [Kineothrix sp. MB12-C1]WMC92022.1 lactate utilization protein [Kineothrix sp. MB12-C1]
MTHKQAAFASAAQGIIKNLEIRGMEGYFFEDSASCVDAIISSIPDNSSISWGGSETVIETGLMDEIRNGNYTLIDRDSVSSGEEKRKIYAQTVLADYYLMSTNAITLQGELVNIDGRGNRVAFLIHGPENVIVIAGMNKLVTDIHEGINRTRNIAAPANAKRLDKKTPCNATGHCGDCMSPDCMCSQIVITRRSGIKGRIKVFLIAEELGF